MYLVRDYIVSWAIYNSVKAIFVRSKATIKQNPVNTASRQIEGSTNHDLYYNGKPYQIHKSCIGSHYIMIICISGSILLVLSPQYCCSKKIVLNHSGTSGATSASYFMALTNWHFK